MSAKNSNLNLTGFTVYNNIQALWTEMQTSGSVDYEGSEIKNIMSQVLSGKISPQEALQLAFNIHQERYDYH